MLEKNKLIVAGPWSGEFGWELMAWQGVLRKIHKDTGNEVHVICKSGHEYLYEDFAYTSNWNPPTKYDPDGWLLRDKDGNAIGINYPYDSIGESHEIKVIRPTCFLRVKQEFIVYGKQTSPKYETLLHARSTTKQGSENRNWPIEKWEELVAGMTGTMASIGTKKAAMHIPGTKDLRGIPLSDLADHMRSAYLVIGPSSGPMHFASLCNAPHVVWSDDKITSIGITNRERYEKAWNPHNTPCVFVDGPTWCPSVKKVLEAIVLGNWS